MYIEGNVSYFLARLVKIGKWHTSACSYDMLAFYYVYRIRRRRTVTVALPPNRFNNTNVLLFQWGGLMVLLFSINMIYLCCRRSEGEDTVRLLGQKDLETSATEKVISYKDVQLWWSKFYWVMFFLYQLYLWTFYEN